MTVKSTVEIGVKRIKDSKNAPLEGDIAAVMA